jgi:small subunit ribosomal protein S16
MVIIRLKRQGRKKHPFYRVVVTDSRNRRDGEPIQELGYYNPMSKELKLDKVSAVAWIAKGAQVSDTAKRLIDKAPESGELFVIPVTKKPKLSKKAKAKQEAAKEAAKIEIKEEPKLEEAPAAVAEEVVAEAPAEEAVPA